MAVKRSEEYEAYLRSPAWQAKRAGALDAAGRRCQVCNTDRHLDVHHRTYERFGDEDPGDLTVLCRQCHELFHDSGRRTRPSKPRRRKGRKDQRPCATKGCEVWVSKHTFCSRCRKELKKKMRPVPAQSAAARRRALGSEQFWAETQKRNAEERRRLARARREKARAEFEEAPHDDSLEFWSRSRKSGQPAAESGSASGRPGALAK